MVKICARSSVTCAGRGPSRAQASLVELRLENLKHDKFYALLLAQRDGLVIVLISLWSTLHLIARKKVLKNMDEGALSVCAWKCANARTVMCKPRAQCAEAT